VTLRNAWRGLDERLRVVAVLATTIVVLVLGLTFVDQATRGKQLRGGATRGSARSTADDGVRAYRSLLQHYGIATHDQAGAIPADLPTDETLVILDGSFPSERSSSRVRRFVERGGHALIGGPDAAEWIGEHALTTSTRGPRTLATPVGDATYRVRLGSETRWSTTSGGRLVIERRLGRGVATLLSSSAPLQNAHLSEAENAAFGVALVDSRDARFAEGPHGLSAATGFAAIPGGWKIALFGVPFALLLLAIARGRRIGRAEPAGRPLAPARRETIDTVGAAYARSRRPAAALASVGSRVRRDLCKALDLPLDAPPEVVRATALRAGWDAETVDAAFVAPGTRDDVITLGRALARTAKGTP
jgi:hypothetical protein